MNLQNTPTASWTPPVGSGMEIELRPAEFAPPVPDVMVTPDHDVGRATQVAGVLDFHADIDSEDKGFDELRRRAAALGADAVIDAEFEHGERRGMSHLSGIAVRWR